MWMLDAYRAAGRTEFTNREIRADGALRLPELKDNLETRLLLLQRRLEEKRAPVRLVRPGRGRIRLAVEGCLAVTTDRAQA
jgi:adenylate cyclase